MTETLSDIPEGATVVLPPHGFVHLQKQCAKDLDVVNAARVSLSKYSAYEWDVVHNSTITRCSTYGEATEFRATLDEDTMVDIYPVLSSADEGLIRYLLSKKHGTPFEHTFFKFHIKAPIFVFREWHRHRIGVSINEESARYTALKREFYLPGDVAWRKQVGRPGHYTYEPLDRSSIDSWSKRLESEYNSAFDLYEEIMEAEVAKELARAVLPVATYSQMLWSCNARSLMNFLALRDAPTAMYEIKVYAEAMDKIFKEHMPVTHKAFHDAGSIAP